LGALPGRCGRVGEEESGREGGEKEEGGKMGGRVGRKWER